MQKRLELTFTPDYVQWGVWECLRELVQNALDSQDRGHAMTITHNSAFSTLTLFNAGASLTRADLVLGTTDKRNETEMRGQFGEGMKLAWAALCRMGRGVKVVSGEESWTPKIAYSEAYGVQLLVVDIERSEPIEGVCVEITGISAEEWSDAKARLLSLTDEVIDRVSGYWGSILLTANHRGRLYAKGIYICELPDAKFGYDLKDVSLDRDRSIAHDWSLKMEIPQVGVDAVLGEPKLAPEMMAALLDAASLESRAFCACYSYNREFAALVAGEISAKHGDVVVVDSEEDSRLVHEVGRKPLLVAEGILRILEPHLPTAETIAEELARAVECTVDADNLGESTTSELLWVRELVRLAMPELKIVPVRFKHPDHTVWIRDNDFLIEVRRIDAGGGALLLEIHDALRKRHPCFGREFLISAIDHLRAQADLAL